MTTSRDRTAAGVPQTVASGAGAKITDTLHGLKPDGFSDEPSAGMTAAIPAAWRLQAVPTLTGR